MHYLGGGFEPSKITIFNILTYISIALLGAIGLLTLNKFIRNDYHLELILRFKYLIQNIKIKRSSIKITYFIVPALLIQNYFLELNLGLRFLLSQILTFVIMYLIDDKVFESVLRNKKK